VFRARTARTPRLAFALHAARPAPQFDHRRFARPPLRSQARVYKGPARSTRHQIRSAKLSARVFSATAIPKRVRAFSALHLGQTEAWAFSASASTKGSGVLGLYPCEVRVFPALPPFNPRLGHSRPLPLQGSGFASAWSTARVFPAVFRTPEHGCSRLCLRVSFGETSAAPETAHHCTRPFKRATQSTRRARPAADFRPTNPRGYQAPRREATYAPTTARVPK